MWKLIKRYSQEQKERELLSIKELLVNISNDSTRFYSLEQKEKIHIIQILLDYDFEIYKRNNFTSIFLYNIISEEHIRDCDGELDVFMGNYIKDMINISS